MKSDKQEAVYSDKKEALAKAESFCVYRERSQKEVRTKLLEWGMRGDELEVIISELILNNFLNEERFAKAYVSGKFNIKKWGRLKIKQGLKLKGVPDKLLQKALSGIDDDEYISVLRQLAEKKKLSLTEKDRTKQKIKLIAYLQSKGFETNLIFPVLNSKELY
jgi:regulatory protein